MPESCRKTQTHIRTLHGLSVIEVTAKNRQEVMTQICSLLSRRAYKAEGIVCFPIGFGERSVVLLFVDADQRLDQMMKQIAKLQDVRTVQLRVAAADSLDLLQELLLQLPQFLSDRWE